MAKTKMLALFIILILFHQIDATNSNKFKSQDSEGDMNQQKSSGYPSVGIKYKIGSIMYGGHYLEMSYNLLKCEPWRNESSQMFYFQHIKNNQYRIISADSLKPLNLYEFEIYYQFRFNSKRVSFDQIRQKNKKNKKQMNKQRQNYSQQQIWQLKKDQDTEQGFYIKSFNQKYIDVEKVLSRYREGVWSQIKYKDKRLTWIIRQVKNNNFKQTQYYQNNLSQIYRNISFNHNSLDKYEQWTNFFQLFYQFSKVEKQLPKWLKEFHWTHSSYDMLPGITRQAQIQGFKVQSLKFNTKIKPNCVKQSKLAYIWVGDRQMPAQYKKIVEQCRNSTRVLTMKDMVEYTLKWNEMFPETKIVISNFSTIQIADMLRKLYLFFQAGMYADFDTEVNQDCFKDVLTNDVIFTNQIPISADFAWLPQQNFIKINTKFNPQIKKMIKAEIKMQDRWEQCRNRQCLIINCQRHLYDRTYLKGYQ